MRFTGLAARFLGQSEILRARSEYSEFFLLSEVPQYCRIRVRHWSAVVEDDGRADGECTDHPVPHHPSTRREIENPLTAAQVAVQDVFFRVLQQRSPGAVNHA